MRILVVNDDGLHAEGLHALSSAALALGQVVRVAPDRNCSGASQSLTLDRPVPIRQVNPNSWAVTGTPADCVHLAFAGGLSTDLSAMLGGPPNLVLSGVNHGENLGDDIMYSGTVGAAQVAALFGCPAVAISAVVGIGSERLQTGIARVVHLIAQGLLTQGSLWNINLPAAPLQGVRLTSLGRRRPSASAEHAMAPRGSAGWWVGAFGAPAKPAPDSDFAAIAQGYLSITPMKIERHDASVQTQANTWLQALPLTPSTPA